MNFKQTLMGMLLLGLFMQPMVATDMGLQTGQVVGQVASEISGEALEELPWLYRWMMLHSYLAVADAVSTGWKLTKDISKSCYRSGWDYLSQHPMATGIGAALAAYILYYYPPTISFGRSSLDRFHQGVTGWFRPAAQASHELPVSSQQVVVHQGPQSYRFQDDPYAVAECYRAPGCRRQ